jgi:hypothetical protein
MSPTRHEFEGTPDRSQSPSVMSAKRRASIEKLQSAGRVKSSKIFSLENRDVYDPEIVPIVERPSAHRPLSEQFVRNTFTRFDTMRNEKSPIRGGSSPRPAHLRTESENSVAKLSPTKLAASVALPESPEKDGSPSPTKSALSRISQFVTTSRATFDHDNGSWSEGEELAQTPRALHRHNKSVTFNNSPPMINEYEQQTPEPSVSAASGSREGSFDSDDFYDQDVSFDRGSSVDPEREDSFDDDLENVDKTPVVLPEHWSRMSPDAADNSLVNEEDDVFDTASPSSQRPVLGRSESVTSDGESRPLPPLPGLSDKKRRESAQVAAVAQRASDAARNLPAPARRRSNEDEDVEQTPHVASSPLIERAQEMEWPEDFDRPSSKHSVQEEQVKPEITADLLSNEDMGETHDEEHSVLADLDDYTGAAPRISRESILRKVRNTKYDFEDEEEDEGDDSDFVDEQQKFRPSYAELAQMHPDQPIPSREHSMEQFASEHLGLQDELDVIIKEEPVDDSIDLAAIPTMDETRMSTPRSPSRLEDYDRQNSVLRHDVRADSFEDETDGSMYSLDEPEHESTVLHQQSEEAPDGKETLQEAMELLTVKDYSLPSQEATKPEKSDKGFMGLPEYMRTDDDYNFGMNKYITPSPPPSNEATKHLDTENLPSLLPSTTAQWAPAGDEQLSQATEISRPDTPDSVIHHSTDLDDEFEDAQAELDDDEDDEDFETELDTELEPEPVPQRQEIPERRATIKTGGKLKARPSGTPADFGAMFADTDTDDFPVPAIPVGYQAQIENADSSFDSNEEGSKVDSALDNGHTTADKPRSQTDDRKVKLNIDIPAVEHEDWGLEQEFDRVIENQKVCSPSLYYSTQALGANGYPREKKGYTMRENDKLVVASNRTFSGSSNDTSKSYEPPSSTAMAPRPSMRGARSSPRKPSAEQYIKTEPWTGKQRRKSKRSSSANRPRPEAAPPLPGQESAALGVVSEDQQADDGPEGAERGRLFVKVVGVKSLDLPLPRNDRVYFKLTLDNGLHCVTTAPLELGKSAPIGQEFELVVHDDLEFQLTLNTKLPPKSAPPPPPVVTPTSPTKHQKQSSISRLLTSPKKRAERERQEREAQEAEQRRQQQEAQRKRAALHPSAWDLMHDLVNAADGSFARSYVNLSSHEARCFGRPLTVDVPCYNEWALEKNSMVVNSVRSKRGAHAGPVRKPPYIIGALELQLLYVPKPTGATDEDMPKSMSSAIREMNRAHEVTEVSYEGVLSQQGGDCQVSQFLPLIHSQ